MGTYLATGIVQKMIISKRDMESYNIPIENIVKSLKEELTLDHYIFSEDEKTIFWTIKPEMLEGNFVEFLEAQFKMYDAGEEDEDFQEAIDQIKEAKTGHNIVELANTKSLVHFQMVDYILGDMYLRQNGVLRHITVKYHLMAFFMDGKVIMECYGDILHYFERALRLQEEKYSIVACLKTMITS